MIYKGYTATVEFDEDEGAFLGKVVDLLDVITFQGKSVDELNAEFQISIDEYLAFCKEKNREPEKPYSGKFNVRITPSLHRKIAVKAAKEHKSINDLVVDALEKVAN